MDQCSPDFFFFVFGAVLEVLLVSFEDVSALCELHYDAERARSIIVEGFLVADDVLVIVGGQNSDLVECVITLLFLHCADLHLGQGFATFFRAYYFPSTRRFTRKTCPKAPSPNLDSTSKSRRFEVFYMK